MIDQGSLYFGKPSAMADGVLEAFSAGDVDELIELLAVEPRLAEKVRRARDWERPEADESDDEVVDVQALVEEALSEPTFGPASDRDAAQYWANLARKLSRAIQRSAGTLN